MGTTAGTSATPPSDRISPEKQLAQAYDAGKAAFTLLLAVIAAGIAANTSLLVASLKDQRPVGLLIGGVIVLVTIVGVRYLGRALTAIAVTILAIENATGVPAHSSVARSLLGVAYGSERLGQIDVLSATAVAGDDSWMSDAEGMPLLGGRGQSLVSIGIALGLAEIGVALFLLP